MQQDALARLNRLRHQKHLGEVLISELLVERQIEAWYALAGEGHNKGEVGILQELLLKSLGLTLSLFKRAAFGQPEINQNFRPVGGWEELLWNKGKAGNADGERDAGQRNHSAAAMNTPGNQCPNCAVRAGIEHLMMVVTGSPIAWFQ